MGSYDFEIANCIRGRAYPGNQLQFVTLTEVSQRADEVTAVSGDAGSARFSWPRRADDPSGSAIERPRVGSFKHGNADIQPFETENGQGKIVLRSRMFAARFRQSGRRRGRDASPILINA
jgi:hypothetical protein